MISPLAHLPELETPADQPPAALAPQTLPLPVCSLLDWLVSPVGSDRESFVKVKLFPAFLHAVNPQLVLVVYV